MAEKVQECNTQACPIESWCRASFVGRGNGPRPATQSWTELPDRHSQIALTLTSSPIYDIWLVSHVFTFKLSNSASVQLCLPGGHTSRRKEHPSIQVSNKTRTCNTTQWIYNLSMHIAYYWTCCLQFQFCFQTKKDKKVQIGSQILHLVYVGPVLGEDDAIWHQFIHECQYACGAIIHVRICSWTPWTTWSDCSSQCGHGQKSRHSNYHEFGVFMVTVAMLGEFQWCHG